MSELDDVHSTPINALWSARERRSRCNQQRARVQSTRAVLLQVGPEEQVLDDPTGRSGTIRSEDAALCLARSARLIACPARHPHHRVNLALNLDDQFDADKDEACRRPTLSDLSYGVERGVADDPPVFIAQNPSLHRGYSPSLMARSSPLTMGPSNSTDVPPSRRRVLMLPLAVKPDERVALRTRLSSDAPATQPTAVL